VTFLSLNLKKYLKREKVDDVEITEHNAKEQLFMIEVFSALAGIVVVVYVLKEPALGGD
jgi:hypothetical protein